MQPSYENFSLALVHVDAELLVRCRDHEPVPAGALKGARSVVADLLASSVADRALVVVHALCRVAGIDGPALVAAAVIGPVDVEAELLD